MGVAFSLPTRYVNAMLYPKITVTKASITVTLIEDSVLSIAQILHKDISCKETELIGKANTLADESIRPYNVSLPLLPDQQKATSGLTRCTKKEKKRKKPNQATCSDIHPFRALNMLPRPRISKPPNAFSCEVSSGNSASTGDLWPNIQDYTRSVHNSYSIPQCYRWSRPLLKTP